MDSLLTRIKKAEKILLDRGKIHSRKQLGLKMGKTEAQVSKAFKDVPKYLTLGFCKAMAAAFPDDINPEYMATGIGNVEKTDTLPGIPHFEDVTVAAGYFDGFDTPASSFRMRPEPYGLPDAEFSLTVSGDSMYPELHNGDIIYLKRHYDPINLPLNKLVVVTSKEGGGVVKKLTEDNPDNIYLQSLNPDYDDIEMHKSEIQNIYRVVGLIRTL